MKKKLLSLLLTLTMLLSLVPAMGTTAAAGETKEAGEPNDLAITVGISLTTGLSFLYDNTNTKVLEPGQYVVSGLADGDEVVNPTITTNSANAGIYDEDAYTFTYDVVNAAGVSTKANYTTTVNKNDVEITKRTITLAADSASKVYDSTALTCHTYTVTEGATEEYKLLAGETVTGVDFTEDSTITHAGSTANKIDDSNATIKKADGSDSSMNYNILTEDGTLIVTQRGVVLESVSAEKYYDGTALQNRQVKVYGFYFDENGKVVFDENAAGFLDGDGCTYDFVNDNVVIDKDGNIIAWTVSESSATAYGQTEVGTSKNEFNYNNFTSVYADSFESDYTIIYGGNQEELGLFKDVQDLYGDLTVWGGPVEITMTDYSWTYDYQAKTNGYFDDGYTVTVTTDKEGTESVETAFAQNSEGTAVALLGSDTIAVTVTGQGGSVDTGKVQHVGDVKQNTATYTIYRNGVDVTCEVEEYYQISISGGELKITPRTVNLTSESATKLYDGTALTNHKVTEGDAGGLNAFVFGEGASYKFTGSQTEAGSSKNTFAITELLTDTKETDYKFVLTEGTLEVTKRSVTFTSASGTKEYDGTALTNSTVTVTGDGFVDGEGYAANVTGAQTRVGTGKNTFTISAAAGTNLNNYDITKVEGTLTVTAASNNSGNNNSGKTSGTTTTPTVVSTITTEPETPTTANFTDVKTTDWYYDAVNYAFTNGLMNGTGDGAFSPAATTTRGMIFTVLARNAGVEIKSTGNSWYVDGMNWAKEQGISDGTAPMGNITREQLATMLYRVAQKNGQGFTGEQTFTLDYPDASTVSDWANEAMRWCVMNGIINGKDGKLAPTGLATRAEVATMLMRYLELCK